MERTITRALIDIAITLAVPPGFSADAFAAKRRTRRIPP
jgi:hypothetical protein